MRDSTRSIINDSKPAHAVDHNLVPELSFEGLLVEKRPAKRRDGTVAEGLYNMWITLNNPSQYNSYTTEMVK
ncbi:MAG: 6-oxocyclohex-1-ene-1-carbonyl-CoA hydratase, partial [Sedimenticola sp.]|nr:6-oxocyclohex-1-ene-1-carbonyl-CoA hydratase [Sedimenticola sp.]